MNYDIWYGKVAKNWFSVPDPLLKNFNHVCLICGYPYVTNWTHLGQHRPQLRLW